MHTHCLVTSVRSNKISSLVQSPVEMKAFFCDETDKAELDIDALMLAASQHYERTLLTQSRPNVGPNLSAQLYCPALRHSTHFQAPPLFHALLPRPPATSNDNHVYSRTWKIKFSRDGNMFTRGGNKRYIFHAIRNVIGQFKISTV